MISGEDIEGLAKLARIELGEEEVASLQKDVSNILDYVGQVSAIKSVSGDPSAPTHRNIMREDVARAADDQLAGKEAAIRAQFPHKEKPARPDDSSHSGGEYNVVRKIIQKDE